MPDYRLAPESPFPAGIQDVEACYRGLVALGFRTIVLSGDSAGGNLALILLSTLASRASSGDVVPTAAIALSPVTDLTLSGSSIETRATADPYFTREQIEALVRAMPHGFVGSVGNLTAADLSLDAVGTFLREQLRTTLAGTRRSSATGTTECTACPGT